MLLQAGNIIFDLSYISECGRARNSSLMTVSSFIDRDHDLTDEIFPWHVAIFRRFADTATFKYACGGTLINPADRGFVILTAGTQNMLYRYFKN